MTKKIVAQKTTSLSRLYLLHGKQNIIACANGAVYVRDRSTDNWVFIGGGVQT